FSVVQFIDSVFVFSWNFSFISRKVSLIDCLCAESKIFKLLADFLSEFFSKKGITGTKISFDNFTAECTCSTSNKVRTTFTTLKAHVKSSWKNFIAQSISLFLRGVLHLGESLFTEKFPCEIFSECKINQDISRSCAGAIETGGAGDTGDFV